jgi:hypothetical protein
VQEEFRWGLLAFIRFAQSDNRLWVSVLGIGAWSICSLHIPVCGLGPFLRCCISFELCSFRFIDFGARGVYLDLGEASVTAAQDLFSSMNFTACSSAQGCCVKVEDSQTVS